MTAGWAVAVCSLLAPAPEVERWGIHEGVFESESAPADPLRELEVTVDLVAPSGRKVSLPAFWDGGKTWRYRFSPDEAGDWRSTVLVRDPSGPRQEKSPAKEGGFLCVPPRGDSDLSRHGRIRVAADRRRLEHADGAPFFWLACTAWNGALWGEPAGFGEYLADRKQKRFTAVQFVTTQWRAAKGDRLGQVAFEGRDKIRINPAFFRRLDSMFAAVNRAGLVAAPVILWAIADRAGLSPGASLPESEALLLARYIVARYGAYQVVWILAGDGDYRGERAEKWKRIGRALFPDAHRNVVTLHPGGMHWVAGEFRGEPWLGFLGYQSGHGDSADTLRWLVQGPPAADWRTEPLHPLINLEPNYEGHLAYQSRKPITDFQVRRAAWWSLLVAPTAGVTYGAHGIWYFSDRPEVPLDHPGVGLSPPYREAMRLPGSSQMAHLRSLFDSIEWWRLRPDPEMSASQPGEASVERWVAAARSGEGDLGVVYVPLDREVVLRLDRFRSEVKARWFDPRSGAGGSLGVLPRGGTRAVRAPVEGDWALVLEASKEASPPFKDAVAAWHFADLSDSAGAGSGLEAGGAARAGEELTGGEGERSRARGGDARVAVLDGGWFDAGQGAGGELNLAGNQMSMLIRLRDPSGKWTTSLFSKHGGHQKLVYNLFTVDLGSGMDLGFELGTEKGMFQVKTPVAGIGPQDWHDVIARYDGKRLQLFVDGVLLDERAASGRLRGGNTEPCLIGAESQGGKPIRPFHGRIDHAALWSRPLGDGEVALLSGGEQDIAERKRAFEERRAARARELEDKLARDPQRPRYHFVPPAHWMNDPNGLCQWKGEYHLFYQHNPHGAFWGTMHWGHAVSKDLVHWTHLPIALAPTPGGPDWDGCFTGCLVDDGGVPTIVYTGVSPETQCLATSRDGLLTWEKHAANPVIAGPPPGLQVTGFRDPYVWKEGDGWYMVVGSGLKGVGGAALLYRSSDLVHWEYLHPLLTGKKETGEMWECPNFFPLGGKHVLLVSVHGTTLYFIGSYRDHKLISETQGSTDSGGHFYAAQCFEDGKGRRILLGWLTEARSDAEQRAAGWSGAQSLPRVLSLLPDGSLGMEPAPELEALRGEQRSGFEAPGDRVEIRAEIEAGQAEEFGLRLRSRRSGARPTVTYNRKDERISINLEPGPRRMGGPLKLSPGEPLVLRVFVDGSVLEVFASGRACLTARVYSDWHDGLCLDLVDRPGRAELKSLVHWEMKP